MSNLLDTHTHTLAVSQSIWCCWAACAARAALRAGRRRCASIRKPGFVDWMHAPTHEDQSQTWLGSVTFKGCLACYSRLGSSPGLSRIGAERGYTRGQGNNCACVKVHFFVFCHPCGDTLKLFHTNCQRDTPCPTLRGTRGQQISHA